MSEEPEQFVVPGIVAYVVEQGARGIGGVGEVNLSAGKSPEQEAVHGAKCQLSRLGAGAGAGYVVEQPGDLGAGEVGIEQQAGFLAEPGFEALAP